MTYRKTSSRIDNIESHIKSYYKGELKKAIRTAPKNQSFIKKFRENHHIIIDGEDLLKTIRVNPEEVHRFSKHWHNLPKDNHLNDQGSYRRRKIGHLKIDLDLDIYNIDRNNTFFQTKEINRANGGSTRYFEEVPESFYNEPILSKLIAHDLSIFSNYKLRRIEVCFHLFRITCSTKETGHATPEGIHRDGHLYVAQHFIAKHNTSGGISEIYDDSHYPLAKKNLSVPLDSILINDTKLKHGVSGIAPKNKNQSGFRDMLIIDYNPQKN